MVPLLIAAIAVPPTYQQDVAPIFAKHCTVCHNDGALDDPETSGGLSLETYERVVGRQKKPIVLARAASTSELLRRLMTADPKTRMPKDEPPLTPREIDVVRRWIEAGVVKGEVGGVDTYRRRESGRKTALREQIVKFDVTAPAKAFGQPSQGPLSLATRLQPLTVMTALAVSPDGSRLAVAGHRRVVVWNLTKGVVEFQFLDPVGMATGLAFSPDGSKLFLVGGEAGLRGELRVYTLSDGKLSFSIGLSTDVLTGLAVHPDGKRVALSGMDRKVRVFDLDARREIWSFRGHSDIAWAVAFSRDGRKVASCGKDKSVKIWNADTGAVEQTLTSHKDEVLAVAFAPDGNAVFSGWKEPQVYFTRLGQGGKAVLSGGHSVALQHFA